jgi:purine-binding chemotaxis protein CheW
MTMPNDATSDARLAALQQRMERLRRRAETFDADVTGRDDVVLQARARLLARPERPTTAEDLLTLVSVRLANELYGIEAADVSEAMVLSDLARLPGVELPVSGISVWRGELLLVLDIRATLGLSPVALNDLRYVVVLGGGSTPVGIMVDEIVGIATIPPTEVRPIAGSDMPREIVRGVTSGALIVLETSALLRLAE